MRARDPKHYCHCERAFTTRAIVVAIEHDDGDEALLEFCSPACADADRAEHAAWEGHGWNALKLHG